jgi:hypothetical protein
MGAAGKVHAEKYSAETITGLYEEHYQQPQVDLGGTGRASTRSAPTDDLL